jgi:Na+/proline symporter
MNAGLILTILVSYFLLLMLISRLTSRHSGDNTFFDGNRESPWFLVAFGMIGSGISAVSLVSIPGNVGNNNLYYFQFILGTLVGYLFIALVLVPIYYKLRVVSIYTYLDVRFGRIVYKTGSFLFLISQSFGAALRLFLSVKILQYAFFDQLGIPYFLTIIVVLLLIWLYTHKSGIKTIVWTDALQSFFLISVIIISIYTIKNALGLSLRDLINSIAHHPYAKLFDWDSHSGSNFFKQFISGFLITVALVGLDQSMMQKTLTINDLAGARKNVMTFSLLIALAQTLFLGLGILIYLFVARKGIHLEMEHGRWLNTDGVYPLLSTHYFGLVGELAFFIGITASTFASMDACVTALTTAFCYDFMNIEKLDHDGKKKTKYRVLLGVNIIMFLIIISFWNSQGAIINTIFKIAGYTYGPILGLYVTGLFTKISLREKWAPMVCVLAALLTWILNGYLLQTFSFDLGFMNIFVNAVLTTLFLILARKPNT